MTGRLALCLALFVAASTEANTGLYVDPELFQESVKRPKRPAEKPAEKKIKPQKTAWGPAMLEQLRAVAAKAGLSDPTSDPPKPVGKPTALDSKFSGWLSVSPKKSCMDGFWRLVEESRDGWNQADASGLKKSDGSQRELMLSITGKKAWETFIAMGVGLDSDFSAGPAEAEIREHDNGKKYLKFILPDAVPGSKLACDSQYWCAQRLGQCDDLYCKSQTTCAGQEKRTVFTRHFERIK